MPRVARGSNLAFHVDFHPQIPRVRIFCGGQVIKTAFGVVAPWRDADNFGPGLQFSADGHVHAQGQEDPRAQPRDISPGFFAAVGVPIL